MPHIHAANERLARRNGRRARDAAGPVNVTQDMSEVTLDVVLRALFGDDLARLGSAAGGNPFALLTDDTARNLAFAYKFRQLGKLIMEDVERRRRDGVRHNDIVSQLHRRARPADRRADVRPAAAGRNPDADRRRPRDDRELAQLVLVPADAGAGRRGARFTPKSTPRGDDAPGYDDARRLPVHAPRASTRRCACIRPAGC